MRKLVPIILIFSVVTLFYFLNTFYTLENNLSDRLTKETRDVNENIKIIAIDQSSIDELGKWPWPRPMIAEAMDKLVQASAKAVWADILYTAESQQKEDDEALAKVAKYKNVFFSSFFQLDTQQDSPNHLTYQQLNWPIIPIDEQQVGHINVMEDRDLVVRRVVMGIPKESGEIVPAISVRLANQLLPTEQQIQWKDQDGWYMGTERVPTTQRGELAFTYATTPQESKFEVIPISMWIKGEVDPSTFKDSLVLIGPYTVGIQDMYYTPGDKNMRMYGVEIHANLIQSFLDHRFYKESDKGLGILILAILSFLSYFLFDRFRAKWALFLFMLLIGCYTVLVILLFETQNTLIPYFYPILAIILAYISSVVSQYLQERKERDRVTGIFGRYVSKGVVNEILSQKEEIQLGGIRKDVTLIFVDIRGFTPLSESMEPEEIIQILNEYLDLCTRAVFAFEGTLDKFIGDGVMSIFGAPIELEDHAHRAVRAALQMKEGANELAQRLQEKYGKTVGFGMGINSGAAVVGNIGSQDRLDYTAIGDTVNLAARLESNAKAGQILISESTYERIKDHFKIRPLNEIKVKGKSAPVKIFEVEEELK